MSRWSARGMLLAAGVGLVLCSSCARVDRTEDFRRASDTVENAVGLRPAWNETFEPRGIHLDEGQRLNLDECIQLALSNNRSLRADLEVIGQARADLVQAGLLPNPMLSVMLGLPEAGGLPSLAMGLNEDIASIWLIPSRKRAAQAMLQQRLLSFADMAVELITDVRTNYAALQYLSLATRLQEENLRVLRDSMDIAQSRLRAGDTSQLDVNLIQARLVEAEIEQLQLRSDFHVTQRTLLRLMGVSKAQDDWQPVPLSLDAPVRAIPLDEETLVETALAQRLDVQAARWELESAVAEFQQQRLRRIQSLSLGVAGERFERRGQTGRDVLADTARASLSAGRLTAPEIESAAQRRQERKQEIDYILGPSLDIELPIFDQNQAQIAKAQYRARELDRRYEEREQRAIEGVRTALTQRRLAEDRVRLYRESLVPLQESNLELAQTTYRSGRESILSVLLAQEELIRTQLDYAAALRDAITGAANLERQVAGRIQELADDVAAPAIHQPGQESLQPPPDSPADESHSSDAMPQRSSKGPGHEVEGTGHAHETPNS